VINIARYGDPAVHPAPIKETKAEAARAFRRPIQSATQPWKIDPNAAPAAKRALTAPRMLDVMSARSAVVHPEVDRPNVLCSIIALSCCAS
jgi:hypothetical protein